MRRLSTRSWGVAVALLLGAPAALGALPAYVSFDPESVTWRIGNTRVERVLTLDGDGRFSTARFVDRISGRDWAPPNGQSGEFHTGDAPVTLTGADAFRLRVQGDGSNLETFWVHNFTWSHPEIAFWTQEDFLASGDATDFSTGPFGDLSQDWESKGRRYETVFSTGPFGNGAAWFAVRDTGDGAGLFGGWEWSGTGTVSILADRRSPGIVTLGVGFADGHFLHDLAPGDSFTAPAGFVGLFSGGWDDASQATRRLVDRHLAPPLPDPTFPWVGFDTWGYGIGIDQGLVNVLIDRAADLGAETFTVDAGWMQRIGDWRPRTGAFDDGIDVLSAHAHARGLHFGLWMAFGVADPVSDVVQTHPDWVATDDGDPIPGDFGSVMLCLANPDVQAWVISEIDRVVNQYGVDWLLHDFGVVAACTNPVHGHQSGDGEWATAAGYYAILDEVRRRHPKLVIENCWNGGSMLDFGMVRRHDTSNTSDYNSAFSGRRGVFGTTYFLPPRYAGKYIGDDGTPPDYRFASGLAGGPLIFMGQPTTWDAVTTAAAERAAALFKELRPVLRDATLTHLSADPAWNGWDGLMCWSPSRGEGILLAFRGESDYASLTLYPSALGAAASVDLQCDTTLGDGTLAGGQLQQTNSGRALATSGVEVLIPAPDGAAIVRLSSSPASPPAPPPNSKGN